MTKYDTDLWSFLSEKSCSTYKIIERLSLAIDVCQEVQKIHEREIVHKDIKPSNIMFDANGGVKLVDFGIGHDTHSTIIGSHGTPGLLAPEQFACDIHTEKIDIWALGKVIVMICFKWSSAWQLLWSPELKNLLEVRFLGPLSKIIDLVKKMVQVN